MLSNVGFCCQIFPSSTLCFLFTPRLWLSGACRRGWGMFRGGLGKKWGPTEGVRMKGTGAYMYGSLCAQQGKEATAEGRGGAVELFIQHQC